MQNGEEGSCFGNRDLNGSGSAHLGGPRLCEADGERMLSTDVTRAI